MIETNKFALCKERKKKGFIYTFFVSLFAEFLFFFFLPVVFAECSWWDIEGFLLLLWQSKRVHSWFIILYKRLFQCWIYEYFFYALLYNLRQAFEFSYGRPCNFLLHEIEKLLAASNWKLINICLPLSLSAHHQQYLMWDNG